MELPDRIFYWRAELCGHHEGDDYFEWHWWLLFLAFCLGGRGIIPKMWRTSLQVKNVGLRYERFFYDTLKKCDCCKQVAGFCTKIPS